MLDHLGAFAEAHGGPKMAQNSTKMAQNITKIALHGPKCPYMTLNGPKTLAMGILHKILSCWTTLRPLQRPFLVMKGHYGAVLGHFGAPMGLCKGTRVVQHDKILCNIPMASVLRPFRVM